MIAWWWVIPAALFGMWASNGILRRDMRAIIQHEIIEREYRLLASLDTKRFGARQRNLYDGRFLP